MAVIRRHLSPRVSGRETVMEFNPLTLAFSGNLAHLEDLYHTFHIETSVRQRRAGLALGAALFAAFGVLDALLVPEARATLWLIRYGGVVPLVLLCLAATFVPRLAGTMQAWLTLLIIAVGAGLVAMTLVAPPPFSYFYYAGLILLFMWGYTLLRARFIWASLAGWVVVVLYEASAMALAVTPMSVLVNNSFYFIGANVVGMFASYVIEYSVRRDYYLEHLLHAEEEKVRAANSELEQRVQDRTARLENANESLRVEVLVRSRAERALRASEQRYRSLVENTPVGILLTDSHGWISELNPALVSILGAPSAEAVRSTNLLTFSPLVETGIAQDVRHCLEAGEPVSAERAYTTRFGKETQLRYHLSAVRDADANIVGVQAVVEDVAERSRLEAQLREAQKMEAVGELAGSIAHEFNNLLTIINGYADMALSAAEEGRTARVELQEIAAAGRHAADLISQLLVFSRRQEREVLLLSLNDVVHDLDHILQSLVGEDVELRLDLADDLGTVEADRAQLEQALINLAINAREAMPEGGVLTVATANVEAPTPGPAREGGASANRYVELRVADTGTGLAPEARERIFEPFFTTKPHARGLGLSAVYGMVKQAEGTIQVESAPGEGTAFRILLPRVDLPASQPQAAQEVPCGEEIILLVEDQEAVRRLAARTLRRLGYRLLEATHGAEALRLAAETDEPIDLVLTDVVMPQMTGAEMVEQLRQMRPDVRVLFMTGYTPDVLDAGGLLRSGAHVLRKPFTPRQLAERVRGVLDAPPVL